MRNRILMALSAFILFFSFVGATPAEPQGDVCGGPGVTFDKPNKWNGENIFRGRGNARNLKGVILFAATVNYQMRCYEPNLNTVILREFRVGLETTVPLSSWQNMFLVVDGNANLQAEPNEQRFPMVFDDKSLVARNLDIRLPFSEEKTLLVVADFSEIKDGDKVKLNLEWGKTARVEPVEVKLKNEIGIYINSSTGVEHYRGNRAPELYFPSGSIYANKYSVFPRTGSPQEEFEFQVQYRDEDGDKPARAEVWIDENGSGEFEARERFPMIDQNPEKSFRVPHTFILKKNFAGSVLKGSKFKFYFADSDKPAAKGATGLSGGGFDPATVFEIQFEQNILVEVGEVRKGGYLPGEIIQVKLNVLVYWQGAIEIDWNNFRKNANSKSFAFKGITVGERRYFSKMYDSEEATLFLEAPGFRAEKKYTVELPALSFVAKVDGRTGKVGLPRFEIPITLKSRLEGPFIDQAAIRVGEPIIYRVRSVRLADAPVFQELEKLTFKPFVEIKRQIVRTQTSVAVIEDYFFTLTLFEVKGEHHIPAFKFPFGELAGFTVTLLPSKSADKITLPYREQNPRTIPRAFIPKMGQMLLAASVLILILLLRRSIGASIRAIFRFRLGRTWQDKVREAHCNVRKAVRLALAKPSRDTLRTLYHCIRSYLILITDSADTGKFIGIDARALQKTLEGAMDHSLLSAFVELEDYLMTTGNPEAEAEEELLGRLDQTTRAMYAHLN